MLLPLLARPTSETSRTLHFAVEGSSMESPAGFVELDRQFAPLREDAPTEDSALESYAKSFRLFGSGALGWDELLQHRLIVVLGEAGSGKTFELRNQAGIRGDYAFLLRLDELADATDALPFSADAARRFGEWRRSSSVRRYGQWRDEPGLFFLDSVDEAKLQRATDFYRALDRLRDHLGGAVSRATIVISSRVTGWLAAADAHEVRTRFPRLASIEPAKKGRPKAVPFVVQLLPLDEARVRKYATARRIKDADAFLQALEDNHAWEFARRPSDVDDLFSFWGERQSLGTLSQILEFVCDRQLRKASDRDPREILSLERAREGAETLAAATVLCGRFTFAVPGDTAPPEGALDALACLPEGWRSEEAQALLTRAIFDGASYGRIRFHHRRLSEFLAARWFSRLMECECSIAELESVLIAFHGGRRILRPATAPVAAWLAPGAQRWQQDVFRWVTEAAPETFLLYGDPAMLSLEQRRAVLVALTARARGRQYLWWESDGGALSRLAHPDLAPDLNQLLRSPGAGRDLQRIALELAAAGRLTACAEAVAEVAIRDLDGGDIFSYATRALEVIGTLHQFGELAAEAQKKEHISERVGVPLIQLLFPRVWAVHETIDMLAKVEWSRSGGWEYVLHERFQNAAANVSGAELIRLLLDRTDIQGRGGPVDTDEGHVATPPLNVRLAVAAAIGLLACSLLSPDEEIAIADAIVRGNRRGYIGRLSDRESKQIAELSKKFPPLRREYFRRAAQELAVAEDFPNASLFNIGIYHDSIQPGDADFEWLLSDIRHETDAERGRALEWALQLWHMTGRAANRLRDIRNAVKNDSELRRKLWRSLHPGVRARWRSWRLGKLRLYRARFWIRRQLQYLGDTRLRVKSRWNLWRYRKELAAGERIGWLAELVFIAVRDGTTTNYIPDDWSRIEQRYGRKCARAVRAGTKLAWRKYEPPLPHERGPNDGASYGTLAGLAGIFAGHKDGDLNFAHLTQRDAQRATRYALNEMNGFAPWLHDLAAAQPRAVQSVLGKCIDAEWGLPVTESATGHLVLYDLAWSGDGINVLVRDDLVERLKHGDPPNFDILRYALAAIMHPEPPDRATLAGIAAARVETLSVPDRSFGFWAMLWVQLDAGPAIQCLERRLATADEKDAENVMVHICARLSGEPSDQPQLLPQQSWLSPDAFLRFVPLVFTYMRADHDIHREGGYTPGARDYAQRFRDTMLGRFSASDHASVEAVIEELLTLPAVARWRDYMEHLLDKHREGLAAATRWTAADVRTFAREHEREARSDLDLFRIGVRRLNDLKNWVERGEDSPRDEVDSAKNEVGFRRWLQRRLNDRSRGRYLIPQEWEIDGGERPDLRLSVPGIAPVSLELKIADKWTLQELLDGLEFQLVGKYMRDIRAHYGIYVLALFAAKRTWKAADGTTRLAIDAVVQRLREQANEIMKTRKDVLGLEVVHIDFSPPA
jgi:hypothetical protein